MKSVKRIFLTSLGALMLAFIITGCSSSSNDNSSKEDAESNGQSTLKVLAGINALTLDLEELPYIQDITENAGVEIDWTYVRTGWEEQKNPLLASGELPDIFISTIGDEDIVTYGNLFLPLNDLIEEHAPNIKKMFEEEPAMKDIATRSDGNIYGLPAIIPHRPSSSSLPMINKEWLDNLGLEEPTTFDEFHNVLKAFKEGDPNGNGKADEIPFDWAPDQEQWSGMALLGAFGNYTIDTAGRDPFNSLHDGEYVFLPEVEDYKELVSFLHKLYSEELINQEVFTQDYGQFFSLAQNPDHATVGYTIGWAFDQRVGLWEDEYEVLLPLAAEEGISPLWAANTIAMKTQVNRAVISADTKDPVAAIKWLDGFYSEEASAQGYYGSFGVGIEKDDDKYTVIAPEDISPDEWKWTNALVDQGLMYVSEDLDERMIAHPSMAERLELDDMLSPYFPKPEDMMPHLLVSEEESSELTILRADLESVISMKWADWISNGGVEEDWESYLEELNKIGLPRYKEILQGAYDNIN